MLFEQISIIVLDVVVVPYHRIHIPYHPTTIPTTQTVPDSTSSVSSSHPTYWNFVDSNSIDILNYLIFSNELANLLLLNLPFDNLLIDCWLAVCFRAGLGLAGRRLGRHQVFELNYLNYLISNLLFDLFADWLVFVVFCRFNLQIVLFVDLFVFIYLYCKFDFIYSYLFLNYCICSDFDLLLDAAMP